MKNLLDGHILYGNKIWFTIFYLVFLKVSILIFFIDIYLRINKLEKLPVNFIRENFLHIIIIIFIINLISVIITYPRTSIFFNTFLSDTFLVLYIIIFANHKYLIVSALIIYSVSIHYQYISKIKDLITTPKKNNKNAKLKELHDYYLGKDVHDLIPKSRKDEMFKYLRIQRSSKQRDIRA